MSWPDCILAKFTTPGSSYVNISKYSTLYVATLTTQLLLHAWMHTHSTHTRTHICTCAHVHTHNTHTIIIGSYPYGSCTPGEARSPGGHFRDYGPAQNKLLKPGQVFAGALTVAPLLVVWAPEVPPGPPLVYTTISGFVHPSFIHSWVRWEVV